MKTKFEPLRVGLTLTGRTITKVMRGGTNQKTQRYQFIYTCCGVKGETSHHHIMTAKSQNKVVRCLKCTARAKAKEIDASRPLARLIPVDGIVAGLRIVEVIAHGKTLQSTRYKAVNLCCNTEREIDGRTLNQRVRRNTVTCSKCGKIGVAGKRDAIISLATGPMISYQWVVNGRAFAEQTPMFGPMGHRHGFESGRKSNQAQGEVLPA